MINKDSYICYNWFPMISDHALDIDESFYKEAGTSRLHNKNWFDPKRVKKDDIVFVKTDYIYNGYFQNILLDKIEEPFILITGISSYHVGSNGDKSYRKIVESKNVIKWFCTNPPELDDKIIPIPIGFEEYEREGGNQNLLNYMRFSRIPFKDKKNKILLPYHNFETNPKRKKIYETLLGNPNVEIQKNKLNFEEYLELLNQYKYIICLEGSGPDVHRNYESLVLDCVPINIANTIENLFRYYKIPGLFLKDWQDLLNFDKIQCNIDEELFYNIDEFLSINFHIENIKNKKGAI